MFGELSVAGFGGGVANAFSPDSKVLGQSAVEVCHERAYRRINVIFSFDFGISQTFSFKKGISK